MIKQLILAPLNGGAELFLFDVLFNETDFMQADSYIAQRTYAPGTVFTYTGRYGTDHYELRDTAHEGLWSYPGDKKDFGRLDESLLLLLLKEVKHAQKD